MQHIVAHDLSRPCRQWMWRVRVQMSPQLREVQRPLHQANPRYDPHNNQSVSVREYPLSQWMCCNNGLLWVWGHSFPTDGNGSRHWGISPRRSIAHGRWQWPPWDMSPTGFFQKDALDQEHRMSQPKATETGRCWNLWLMTTGSRMWPDRVVPTTGD